jgi:formylmethanofuran dehydrogenase subunit A
MNGTVSDLYIRDGHFTPPPANKAQVDQEIDLTGCIVMAGAIDIHSHIAGGNVNNARLLLPELQLVASMKSAGLLKTARNIGGWTAFGTGQ